MNREKSKLQKNAAKDTTPKASQLLNALSWRGDEPKKSVSPKIKKIPLSETGKQELINPADKNVFLSKKPLNGEEISMTVKKLTVPGISSEPNKNLAKLRALAKNKGARNE